MQTGRPKMLCFKHGGSRVKLSVWFFSGRIPGPTDTIWEVLKAKTLNRCGILLVGLGVKTVMKKL